MKSVYELVSLGTLEEFGVSVEEKKDVVPKAPSLQELRSREIRKEFLQWEPGLAQN